MLKKKVNCTIIPVPRRGLSGAHWASSPEVVEQTFRSELNNWRNFVPWYYDSAFTYARDMATLESDQSSAQGFAGEWYHDGVALLLIIWTSMLTWNIFVFLEHYPLCWYDWRAVEKPCSLERWCQERLWEQWPERKSEDASGLLSFWWGNPHIHVSDSLAYRAVVERLRTNL